jgi:hypothetical protein
MFRLPTFCPRRRRGVARKSDTRSAHPTFKNEKMKATPVEPLASFAPEPIVHTENLAKAREKGGCYEAR